MWQVPTAVGNDYWREDNAEGWLPVARFNGSQALGQNQTRYLLDASYLRLKSFVFRIYPACFPDQTMGNTEMPRIFYRREPADFQAYSGRI